MNWRSSVVLPALSRFLAVAVCTSLATVSPAQAAQPATTGPTAQLAAGVWTVQGRAIPGTRRCGDWLVRLTMREAGCPVSFRLPEGACQYRISRCCRMGASRELRRPVW